MHVTSVETSLEFYKRIPGLEVIVHEPHTFALLKIGDSRLGLLRHGESKFHVELDVPDLDQAYAELLAVGIQTQGPPTQRAWGERDLWVLDPDGNLLEFGAPNAR